MYDMDPRSRITIDVIDTLVSLTRLHMMLFICLALYSCPTALRPSITVASLASLFITCCLSKYLVVSPKTTESLWSTCA